MHVLRDMWIWRSPGSKLTEDTHRYRKRRDGPEVPK
jgi:hypothetical protein